MQGLALLNNYLLDLQADGLYLGWWPQTGASALSSDAPLQEEDVYPVILLGVRQLASEYGISLKDPVLVEEIERAEARLNKRRRAEVESDFSDFPRAQGSPWGGPGWGV